MISSCWLGFHPPCSSGRPLPRGASRTAGQGRAKREAKGQSLAAAAGDAAAICCFRLFSVTPCFASRCSPVLTCSDARHGQRIGKRACIMGGRYIHAEQFKRAHRAIKFLRTRLGRVIRDIRRRIDGNSALEYRFHDLLMLTSRVKSQDHRQRGPKVSALHAPAVECIGKGKAQLLRLKSGSSQTTTLARTTKRSRKASRPPARR
jgi:hypothetical protein